MHFYVAILLIECDYLDTIHDPFQNRNPYDNLTHDILPPLGK